MWIISNALMKACENLHCSQALVEESSEDTCWDGEQSAQLSGNHTQLAYLPPDKMTAFSRLSRFGMTFKPLTESRGAELLTLYLAASLARTYPQQAKEQELKEADQECGNTWQELSVKYDLDSHSWRTHLCLWDEALQWSSVTLPKWGMTVSGVLFQHPTAERPINGTGSGLWPTPTAHNAKETNAPSETLRNEATLASRVGGHLNPDWVELLMGWPKGWSSLQPIDRSEFNDWHQGFSGQNMRVRSDIQPPNNAERQTSGCKAISGAEVLQPEVRKHKESSEAKKLPVASQEISEGCVRGVRLCKETRCSPLRSGSDQQQPDQSPNIVQPLPRLLARYGKEAWKDGRWEDAVSRVAKDVAARVDRLKAIGNGQVPICAARAFQILAKELF